MGEVYRALDTRLNRIVALKMTHERFSERFDQEARAVAALNHPNICTLHDVGPNYLVMEMVEGETLADRIKRGAIPLEEALTLARQIAEALQAAHQHGIIHRDLKPANIKIKPDGTVKVLDFGLAKIAERSTVAADSRNTATTMLELTQAGQILGTAAYMAPEQARGKGVDKRADIWAFGAVLYEMLTGKRLFDGESLGDTLAAVLTEEPNFEAVPVKARWLLKSCLQKDPKHRLHDIADAHLLLHDPNGAPTPVVRRTWLPWGLSAALGAATLALAFAFLHSGGKATPAESVRFQIPLPAGAMNFVLSPDGRRVGFMAPGQDGQSRLWVRALESLEPHALPGTENVFTPMFWSPDSRFIVFQGAGQLRKIDVLGGPPQTICETPELVVGGAWSPKGVIIFNTPSGFMRISASGGAATQLTASHGGFQVFPTFLPDGVHFLYYYRAPKNAGIYVGSLNSTPGQQSSKLLVATPLSSGYAPSEDPAIGHLLFMRDGSLMTQAFDNRKLEPFGDPVLLVERVGSFRLGANFSVSESGVLAYRGTAALSGLTWFDRQGKSIGSGGEPGAYTDLSLSPDGNRAAVTRTDATGQGLWLFEFARGISTRFTFDTAPDMAPVWSPDGTRIAFRASRDGLIGFFEKASNGAGQEVMLLPPGEPKVPNDWSHDGRFLLYSQQASKTKSDLWVMPLAGARTPVPFLQTEFNQRQGQFSPDSHWVAYVSNESGRPEIYVRPFPTPAGGGSKSRVSSGGADQPRWRRSGKELFYMSLDGKVMAVDVNTGSSFSAGNPKELFRAPIFSGDDIAQDVFRWDVSADGERFLIDTAAQSSEPITVVLNWTADSKK